MRQSVPGKDVAKKTEESMALRVDTKQRLLKTAD
jgi:hypothetical protein